VADRKPCMAYLYREAGVPAQASYNFQFIDSLKVSLILTENKCGGAAWLR